MPLINRVGGGGAELQSKTVYPNIFTRKYTSNGWNDGYSTVEYTPDNGYDGFSSIIVKEPSIDYVHIYDVWCEDYRTLVFDLGDGHFGYDLSDTEVLKNFFKRVFQLVIFHTASASATDNEITSCVITLETQYTGSELKVREKGFVAHQEGGIYAAKIHDRDSPSNTFEFDADTLKLTWKLDEYQSDRTDGYGYKLKTSGTYRAAFLVYKEI